MSDPEDNSNKKESWFFDNDFNGLPDDIVFDDVLKFLDLPLEDVDPNGAEEDWSVQFQSLGEPCFDAFSVSSAGLHGESKIRNEIPRTGKSLSAPYNEIPLIKQVAKIAGPTYGKTIPNQNVSFYEKKDLHQYRSYSPVSVFEGSSTSSAETSSFDLPVIPVKRARSKRRRPSILNPVFSISFIPPNSLALQKYHKTPTSESDSNKAKKPRKRDLSVLSGDVETSSSQDSVVTRKCSHCEITKTPQWREGPKGPKTLCNACGVRYRSGRLYPEYRPAASPTFVESIHSNCHKKVMEMRCKVIKECVRAPSRLAT